MNSESLRNCEHISKSDGNFQMVVYQIFSPDLKSFLQVAFKKILKFPIQKA